MSRSKRLCGVANAAPILLSPYGDCSTPQVHLLQPLVLMLLVLDVCIPISYGLGFHTRPSVYSFSFAWRLTIRSFSMDSRISQTSTASPAKPGDLLYWFRENIYKNLKRLWLSTSSAYRAPRLDSHNSDTTLNKKQS